MKKALVVIDIQNDYLPDGGLPLWNSEDTIRSTVELMSESKKRGIPVVLIQHIIDSPDAPFFRKGSAKAAIHPAILEAAPDAPVVVKKHADSFLETNLEQELNKLGVEEILLCGMMTHNCVTHTALSKAAEKYKVSVVADACTTVTETMHQFALAALESRVTLMSRKAL